MDNITEHRLRMLLIHNVDHAKMALLLFSPAGHALASLWHDPLKALPKHHYHATRFGHSKAPQTHTKPL